MTNPIKPPPIQARGLLNGEAIRFDEEERTGVIRYVPRADLLNPAGTVFGGYLAAMLDDVAGLATWYGCGKRTFSTSNMSVSFLYGVESGEPLIGTARVVSVGARQAFVSAQLEREVDGELVTHATMVQVFVGD